MNEKINLIPGSEASREVVFPRGIPGFDHLKRYQVLYSDTDSGRVYWMQSCEAPDITFTLVEPKLYGLNYTLELTDDEQALLQAEEPGDIVVLLMLWKQDASEQPGLHANIAGPILINVESRRALQKLIPTPKIEVNVSS